MTFTGVVKATFWVFRLYIWSTLMGNKGQQGQTFSYKVFQTKLFYLDFYL